MIDILVQCFRSPQIETTTHLAVMLAIARRCGDEKGVCYAKQKTLAADTRLHPRSVGIAIKQLEDGGLIRRVKGTVDAAGRRSTDHLYITLKAVTLPATGPAEEVSPDSSPVSPGLTASESLTHSPVSPGLTIKKPLEETYEDNKTGAARDVEIRPIDYPQAVELIWRSVGDEGRRRSSHADIESALKAAIKRRPKDRSEEDHLRLIFSGIRAYLSSAEAKKENGAFERGAHRTIVKDRWRSYLDGDSPMAADAIPIDPQIGTDVAPGVLLQRHWAELASQGMPWNEERGPRPGRMGCRIAADIQREFGFTPYEGEAPMEVALAAPLQLAAPAPPADDNAALFD